MKILDDRGVAGLTEDEEIEAVNEPDIIDITEREEQEDVKNFSELMHYNTEEDYMMKQETFDGNISSIITLTLMGKYCISVF